MVGTSIPMGKNRELNLYVPRRPDRLHVRSHGYWTVGVLLHVAGCRSGRRGRALLQWS